MLLHGSRQRIEVASSRVRGERLPFGQSSGGGTDRSVDISGRSLSDVGEFLPRGRVRGFEVRARSRWLPGTGDEMSEAAAVTVEPG